MMRPVFGGRDGDADEPSIHRAARRLFEADWPRRCRLRSTEWRGDVGSTRGTLHVVRFTYLDHVGDGVFVANERGRTIYAADVRRERDGDPTWVDRLPSGRS